MWRGWGESSTWFKVRQHKMKRRTDGMSVLSDTGVISEFRRAWVESKPGTTDACEEGGFVLQRDDGSLTATRWPRGIQDRIEVPEHEGGRFKGALILATFHTHPNTGPEYEQEPSLTDIRAVRDDPELRHGEYEGEYVISEATLYLVRPDGTVESAGATPHLLHLGTGAV
jgi:hypothetical protein